MKQYNKPKLELLNDYSVEKTSDEELKENVLKLELMLKAHDIDVKVESTYENSYAVVYGIKLLYGCKVKQIENMLDDIKYILGNESVTIEVPWGNKSLIGIVARKDNYGILGLKSIINKIDYKNDGRISYIVGEGVEGKVSCEEFDASKGHLLIAGATGSGKSKYLDSMILSMIFNYSPEELRMIMVDTKGYELGIYKNLIHLLMPVVTDRSFAFNVFEWLYHEMKKRLNIMNELHTRNIESYNKECEKLGRKDKILNRIVAIIDDISDLFDERPDDLPQYITRLTLLARAAGIHFVVVTQNPTAKVLNVDVKYNFVTRMAFGVASSKESVNILAKGGAEKLKSVGEMLYSPMDKDYFIHVQAPYVSDEEIKRVLDYINANNTDYTKEDIPSDTIARFNTGLLF